MWVAVSFFFLFANLVVHEVAHALALRATGARISELGLGVPLPPRLKFHVGRGQRSLALSFSPWLIGAYVRIDPESERLEVKAPFRQRAWFAGAGVVSNLIMGLILNGVLRLLFPGRTPFWLPFGLAALVYLLRRLIVFVVPFIGVAALWVAVQAFASAATTGEATGPVGVIQHVAASNTLELALNSGVVVAYSLAIINCLPIFPFDGGRIVAAAVHSLFGERASTWFAGLTALLGVGAVLYAIGFDIWMVAT